jgi:hypothetical protein
VAFVLTVVRGREASVMGLVLGCRGVVLPCRTTRSPAAAAGETLNSEKP